MVAYSDPYKDADKIFVRALTGAIAELFYHKMSSEDEQKFIEVIKSVDNHFENKKDILAENNTTSPNHPVRQEAKKSIEERRLIALKKKLKDLKYTENIPEDITADELQKKFDQYVEELIDKQIEHGEDSTDKNNDLIKDMEEADESIKEDGFYITFDTNLQDFDVKNRNQRYYDAQNIWECIQSEKIQ